MIVAQEMEHLHKLAERHPDKQFTHLWGHLTSETWLTHAWEGKSSWRLESIA